MRTTRRWWIAALAVATTCSDGDETRCASVGDASVCAEHTDGQVSFTAEGLRAGSSVTVTNAMTGTAEVPVNSDGGFDGQPGIMSATGDFQGEITVNAITADGLALAADLVFE